MLNAANLCPSPTRVQHRVFELTRDVDADASFTNRAKFGEQREEARTAVAAYVGASIDEIAMVRNTSEANNTVVGGLQLTRGDEVVIWDGRRSPLPRDVRSGARVVVEQTIWPPAEAGRYTLALGLVRALTAGGRSVAISRQSASNRTVAE